MEKLKSEASSLTELTNEDLEDLYRYNLRSYSSLHEAWERALLDLARYDKLMCDKESVIAGILVERENRK